MNKTINLPFLKQLDVNIAAKNSLIQVIIGPRQVGKTTTILNYLEQHLKNKAHYVSADQIFHSTPQWVEEQWRFAHQQNKMLIIDEIQKCENWPEIIKSLWDEFKRKKIELKCVLLGSSSLQIQKGLTESLTGRFQLIYAYHWNYKESHDGYGLNFEQYLKFGGYPGSYQFLNTQNWESFVKNSIVSTVIEKDILQYSTVKSPTLFKQAFEILISYPAQEISYTKLLGQLQNKGNVELIKYYIRLYEGAFLVRSLEKFSNKKIKIKTSSPKILPMAPCLYFLNILDEYSSEERGHAFELLVGTQLVRTGHELYYWREGKYEVDYILKKGKKIWAIEVKSGRNKTTSGLQKFRDEYPHSSAVLISPDNYQEFEKDPMAYLEAV